MEALDDFQDLAVEELGEELGEGLEGREEISLARAATTLMTTPRVRLMTGLMTDGTDSRTCSGTGSRIDKETDTGTDTMTVTSFLVVESVVVG